MKAKSRSLIAALALAVLSCGSAGSSRAQETVTIGTPGIPPVFIAVQVFVAQDQKFFEKYGVKVNIRQFVKTLQKVGYQGSLCIEREVGTQQERLADIAHGIRFLQECVKG